MLYEVKRRAVIEAQKPLGSNFSPFAVGSVTKVGKFCAADMQCLVVQISSEGVIAYRSLAEYDVFLATGQRQGPSCCF